MLDHLLSEFNPLLPLAEARTAPASWYTNSDFFSAEAKILKDEWQFVAPLALLSENGSFHCGEFLGEPYIIVRDEQGELRAFHNVCRHHAAALANGNGSSDLLVCPYHGWSYSLQGALLKAPGLGAVKNFKKEEMNLVPIPLQVEGPFVLLNFSGKTDYTNPWGDLFLRLEKAGLSTLKFVSRKKYEIRCNWKVYVDNYLDGGYHVSVLHKNLASQLAVDDYKIENFSNYTLQSCAGKSSKRIGKEALYAWLYPNFMINRYGATLDTNWVIPISPDRCVTIFDFYFEESCSPDFIEESLLASERVQAEDIQISESVQKGLGSQAYKSGRYSVTHESGMYLFHQWLHRDLS